MFTSHFLYINCILLGDLYFTANSLGNKEAETSRTGHIWQELSSINLLYQEIYIHHKTAKQAIFNSVHKLFQLLIASIIKSFISTSKLHPEYRAPHGQPRISQCLHLLPQFPSPLDQAEARRPCAKVLTIKTSSSVPSFPTIEYCFACSGSKRAPRPSCPYSLPHRLFHYATLQCLPLLFLMDASTNLQIDADSLCHYQHLFTACVAIPYRSAAGVSNSESKAKGKRFAI